LNIAAWAYRVGLERSKVEIQFTNISYEAEVLIGSAGLPSVSNSFKNLALVLSLTLYPAAVSAAQTTACKAANEQMFLPCPYLTHCDWFDRALASLLERGLEKSAK